MANAYFISETYLKDNSPLNNAVDMSEIYPFARTAEEIWIQEAIGTCLYDDLIDKVIASKASPPTAISTDDKNLIKKIRKALVWLTIYEALPFISTKIRNIGVVQQNGTNLENADSQTVKDLRKEIKGKADFYMEELQRFLCKNSSLYPEYYCDNWDCTKLFPNTNVSRSLGLSIEKYESIDTKILKRWFL